MAIGDDQPGWSESAARALAETFEGGFEADGVAIAAAAVDDAGIAVRFSPDDTPSDGRFEIGSVTKTMTATMLALLAAEGRLGLDDEAGRWLSAGGNGTITLRQLATHTSGLPRLGPNFRARPIDPSNPWAGFTFAEAEEGLRQAVIDPARAPLYSNLGYQLLGLVLERASGQDYGTLITERLLRPLGMTASCVGPDGGGTPVPGHARGQEARRWDQPLGAGGVEATIGDLARYARACLRPPPGELGAAISAAQEPLLRVDEHNEQALGWKVHDRQIRWHTGGTGGFSSCVMADPGQGRAVAMLASQASLTATAMPDLSQAGLLALAGELPAQASPREPWPRWEHDTSDIARLLLERRFREVHTRLTPALRALTPVQRLEQGLGRAMARAGRADGVCVDGKGISASGIAAAIVTIGFPAGPLRIRLSLSPDGTIAGATVLAFPGIPGVEV